MKLVDIAKEMFKTADRVIEVKAQVTYMVPARSMARRSAAGKYSLRFPVACLDSVIFEKRDRQEGNGAGAFDGADIEAQVFEILLVDGIVFYLEMKEL